MGMVKLFKEVMKSDIDKIGHKGLNLATLANEGFNVPPGFIISTAAFDIFLNETKLMGKIKPILEKLTEENADRVSAEIKKLIINTEIPKTLEEEIIEAYESLGFELNKLKIVDLLSIKHSPLVAVRSSYIEKIDDEIVKQLTLLNVKGKNNLFNAIKECWASLYDKELLIYRMKNNLSHEVSNAIVIQKMIDAESSGISCSSNPESKKKSEILVKACFGFGETINEINPDNYVVNKEDLSVKDMQVNEQEFCLVMDHAKGVNAKKFLKEKGKLQKLNNRLVSEVARITKRISEQLGQEQIIEWCMYKDNIYILQSKDLDMDFEDEKMEVEQEEVKQEEEKPTVDIYEPALEDDLKVLDEIESDEEVKEEPTLKTYGPEETKIDEGIPEETDEEIKHEEEERKEEDVVEFVDKVEEEKEPVEEEIPSIDDIEEVEEKKIEEPKINSTGMPSYYDDTEEEKVQEDVVEEEKNGVSFDLIKDLTRKMEQQFNDDDIEGYEETRKELKRTLEEL